MENLPPRPNKWYYGILPVLGALFFLGPFAFPLLWKSPQFNLFWKVFLTVAVTAATVWMLKATMGIVDILMQQINEMKQSGLLT